MRFVITSKNNNKEPFKSKANEGEAIEYTFDFSPWSEDHGDIESVTWTKKYGQASISNEALSSNSASALITFSQSGGNLIEIKATSEDGEIFIAHLDVLSRDHEQYSDDYGMC